MASVDEYTGIGVASRSANESALPFTRAGGLKPLIEFLGEIDVSIPAMLREARVPADLLEDFDALVPIHLVHRFVETCASSQGIENLGAVVAARTSAFDVDAGVLGPALRRAVTVYDYLQTGSQMVGAVTGGARFWLTLERNQVRFHHLSPGKACVGRMHEDVFCILLTIRMLREFVGTDWQPGEVRLMAPDVRLVGDPASLGSTDVHFGQPHSSFTMPFWMLQRTIPAPARGGAAPRDPLRLEPAMPHDFVGSIEVLVQSLLTARGLSIELVAEAADMSVRSLQRRLLETGRSYSDIVQHARVSLASEWLLHTTMPVRDIAFSLGYTDAANFTRAFRRVTAVSPQQFRKPH